MRSDLPDLPFAKLIEPFGPKRRPFTGFIIVLTYQQPLVRMYRKLLGLAREKWLGDM